MDLEPRFAKIDDAIQRLAQVSADVSKMLAVHELRLSQQEKGNDTLTKLVEDRRKEFDESIGRIYDQFREEDALILKEIKENAKKDTDAHDKMNQKINKIEKLIWMVSGGGLAIGYLLSFVANYYKVLSH